MLLKTEATAILKSVYREAAMYAKFPFYSVAQMYALTLNTPVAIMLGADHLYWVVDQGNELKFMNEGCALLSRPANATC